MGPHNMLWALPIRYPSYPGGCQMPTLKLTQAAVNNRKPPMRGRKEVWDSPLPGFGLRNSATGRKTWQAFYRVGGKPVREKLGTLAQIPNVAGARELARQSMTKARSGANPVEDRRRRRKKSGVRRRLKRLAETTLWPRRSIAISPSARATRAGAQCVPNTSPRPLGPSREMSNSRLSENGRSTRSPAMTSNSSSGASPRVRRRRQTTPWRT